MSRAWPTAAAALAGVQVGAAIVATRFAMGEVGPATLALLRYAIGFACLLPAVLLAGAPPVVAQDRLPVAVLGILQFGVLIALLNWGLQAIPSARAALIFATFPLLTLLCAAGLRRERITLAKASGIGATVLGVGVSLGEKAFTPGAAQWLGELAVFAAALTGAVCSVLYRPYVARSSPLTVGAVAMLASVLFLALPAAHEGFFQAPPNYSVLTWANIAFIGVGSGIGYFLWLWALSRLPATQVTVFLSLSPIAAALLGAWLLAEPLTTATLAGLALVALGLWLAMRQRE